MSNITLNHRRTDRLTTVFVALSLVAIAGILLDSWHIVFLSVPALISVLFIQGSLRQDDSLDRTATAVVTAYLAGLFALFIAVVLTSNWSAGFGGLSAPMAIIFYLIWPYTAVVSGVVYAFVFHRNRVHELAS